MQLSAPATTLDLLATPAGVNDALLALVASPAATMPGTVPAASGQVDFAALLPEAAAVTSPETETTPSTAAAIVPPADSGDGQRLAPGIATAPVAIATPVVVANTPRLARAASNPPLTAQSRSAGAGSATPLTSAPRSARHIASPLAPETDEPETLLPESSPVALAQPSPVEAVIAATLPVAANLALPNAPVSDVPVDSESDLSLNVARRPFDSANTSPSFTARVSFDQPRRGAFPSARQRGVETAAPSPAAVPAGTETFVPAKIAGPQIPVSAPREPRRDEAPLAAPTVSTEVRNALTPELAKKSAPGTTDLDPLVQSPARVGAVALNGPLAFAPAAGRLGATAPTELPSDRSDVVPLSPASPVVPVSEPPVAEPAASVPFPVATPTAQTTALNAPDVLPATDVSSIPTPTPTPSPRRGEKIAAAFGKNFGERISARASSAKTFLESAEEEVTTGTPALGIDVAKTGPTMPALAFAHHLAPDAAFTRVAPAQAMVATVEQAAQTEQVVATDAPVAAHRAVEAALAAAERFSAGDRHAVNLQFSVGGADLAVRVELRADEVRATFRTDSPELRSALAHEWFAVVADAGERSFRLAPPVITSNSGDTSGLAAFNGDSAPRQRDSQARRASHDVFASVASRARSAAASAVGEVVAPAARLGLLPTSLHLHTLA